MSNPIFENHDAELLYNAVIEKNPDIEVHGNLSVQYALYLYYKTYPEERPANYRGWCRHMRPAS